ITEDATDTLDFTPVNDPQASIGFFVDTKGTGSWTVTIHDQQNNVIATQTIANANVPAGGEIEFIFTTPWRIVIGKTYHAHLTVSTGTSKCVTSSASDFSTAEYTSYFSFLVTDTDFHPITLFTNKLVIGNERYLATWDGAFYQANAIAFPTGWRVRCFGIWREYLAVGVWKGSTITSYDAGRIYFWDGYAPTFNFAIDVPLGQINALVGRDSDLYIIPGWMGYLSDYQGGYLLDTGNSSSEKLKRFPKRARTDYVEVYPGAFCFWRDLLHIGIAANSNSTTIEKGVYSWGTYNQLYPSTLSYDYPISTGNRFNTVSIGCMLPIGQNLIIGWQDGGAFGADVINFSNNPAPSGTIELLAQDDNAIWHDKETLTVRADYLPLPSGTSVQVKYQIDRSGTWTTSDLDSTTGDKFVKIDSVTSRGREYQYAVDLFSTGANSPTL
ncbi:MAG: hypothetical protein KGN01_08290, partial [Patescibacteria group bacterium]|nr:hypothetical protein [Patescibacteria group bacterium]